MPAVPPSDSDSHNGELALRARGRRIIERVGWKLPKSSGKQSQNVEHQALSSPTSYRERVRARASFQSVSPRIKLLEAGTPEQLSTPHANSPQSVQETTQEEEEEEEDEDRAENIGAVNGNDRKDPDFQTEAQQTMMHQDNLIDRIEAELQRTKAELRAAQQQIEQDQKEHSDEVEELNRDIRVLRAKVTEKSSKSIEAPIQLPLRCPESEIIKAWHELNYDVGNLVLNHFKGTRESRMVAWAQKQKAYLRDVTPHYMEVIIDKKCAPAFVEAVIWNALCLCAFGPYATDAPFCWAGKYKRNLATMSNQLLADVGRSKPKRQKAMFYQWIALTANLISPTISEEDREKENAEIVEDLDEMLDGLSSSLAPWSHRSELRTIVNKAVNLATRLCGQQTYYGIGWPSERRYNMELDHRNMKLAVGSPKSKRVRFMVGPSLFGSKGEDHDELWILDSSRVWAYGNGF